MHVETLVSEMKKVNIEQKLQSKSEVEQNKFDDKIKEEVFQYFEDPVAQLSSWAFMSKEISKCFCPKKKTDLSNHKYGHHIWKKELYFQDTPKFDEKDTICMDNNDDHLENLLKENQAKSIDKDVRF